MTKSEWKKIRGSKPNPDHIMLSLKNDVATSRTVTWRTSLDVENGFVLYREHGKNREWLRSEAEKNSFSTDVDDSNYFFCDINGLTPATYYDYTCGDENNRSEVFTFKTSPENSEKFSFLCLSDVQTGGAEPPADYTVLGEVLKKILSQHPEIEFILTAGDNTNCGQTDVQWTGLMDGLKGIIEEIPLMLCMGNHDDMGFADYFTFTGKYYSEKATYFSNQLKGSYPYNGPEGWKTANYSFDYGNVHFAVLGTSGFEYINEWLIKDMDASDKTWKFASHHFPVCYAGPEIENEDTYPALRDGMEKCDIVFSGHEHSFARSYPRRKDGLYDKPSQGTVHYNIGSGNRNPPGTRVVPKVWNAKTYCHEEDLSMFTVVDINGSECTLTAYVEDGRIVDRAVIDKKEDRILPYDCAPVYNRTRLKFKGYDLGICNSLTLPQNVDGKWYIAPGQLINFLGGDVERAKGSIKVGIYKRFAEFKENSDVMCTKDGDIVMSAPCLRLSEDQLFVPVEDFVKPLRMSVYYFEHNNFIDIESESEERPIPLQP